MSVKRICKLIVKKNVVAGCMMIALAGIGMMYPQSDGRGMQNEKQTITVESQNVEKTMEETQEEIAVREPENLYAQSAVLMDAGSGRILFAKNGQQARAMASTTKIMTCILALEYGNLDTVVTASALAASQPQVRLGVTEGQQFYMRDLLYSMMLESHNDAAVMIAEQIGGTVEGFADMMNAKAKEIGCMDTYFITPNGLDASDENGIHHTNAEDLARIMKYCIQDSSKHGQFLAITGTDSYQFQDCTNVYTYSCTNHNAFMHMMEGVLSGKTGFTNDAGYCYVGALEQDGKKLIVALLACGWPNNKAYKWSDTRALMTYGLEQFQMVMLDCIPAQNSIKNTCIHVAGGVPDGGRLSGESTAVVTLGSAGKNLSLLLRRDQSVEIQTETEETLIAPVKADTVVGNVRYLVDGETVLEYPIRTTEPVEKLNFTWCFSRIAEQYFTMH